MLGGAAVAVLAGVVGIEVSFHAHSAAGASVALALCAAAALGSALRPSRGGRGAARGHDPGAERQHCQADELRLGEAHDDLVVAADELDQEALDPGDHQVEAEQHPGRQAVAQAPQHQPASPIASVS